MTVMKEKEQPSCPVEDPHLRPQVLRTPGEPRISAPPGLHAREILWLVDIGGTGSIYLHVYDVQVFEHRTCPGVPLDPSENPVPNPSVKGDRMPSLVLVTDTRGILSVLDNVEHPPDSQWIDPGLVGQQHDRDLYLQFSSESLEAHSDRGSLPVRILRVHRDPQGSVVPDLRSHVVGVVSKHHDDVLDPRRTRGVDRIPDQRAATEVSQGLRRTEPGCLPRSEHDGGCFGSRLPVGPECGVGEASPCPSIRFVRHRTAAIITSHRRVARGHHDDERGVLVTGLVPASLLTEDTREQPAGQGEPTDLDGYWSSITAALSTRSPLRRPPGLRPVVPTA